MEFRAVVEVRFLDGHLGGGEASLPGATIVLPLIYGVGTALPVLLVAFLLAYSVRSIGKAYNAMAKIEC
jgi:hypothetical protein